jgi:hypothetical protein
MNDNFLLKYYTLPIEIRQQAIDFIEFLATKYQNQQEVTIKVSNPPKSRKRVPGSLLRLGLQNGKTFTIPDDFNAPLEDLNDYM